MKSSSSNSTPILLTALILAILSALYYFVVMPKQQEVSTVESSVATLETSLTTIQQQIDALNSEQSQGISNEFVLRKKLPANRAIEQLLLNIEEMEYVTGTRVTAMSFNNYDALVNGSGYTDPNAPKEEEGADSNAEQETTDEATPTPDVATAEAATTEQAADANNEEATAIPVSLIDALTLPPNLKMVTFDVTVEAPDEKQLTLFLKEIEKLERIMLVETIDFDLHGEENKYDKEATNIVSTTVQVTTFYYE